MRLLTVSIFLLLSSFMRGQLLDSLSLDSAFLYTSIEEAMKEPDKVIKLELKKQKLKSFPVEIFTFRNLQYLDVSKNNLKEIPDSLDMLPDLQYFNASKNRLESIPKTIGKLVNMKWFIWNNNDLGAIPYQMGNLEKLEYLDLWNNNLSYFPESLEKLKNLKIFDLRHILLNEEQQAKLREMMPNTQLLMDRACNCN